MNSQFLERIRDVVNHWYSDIPGIKTAVDSISNAVDQVETKLDTVITNTGADGKLFQSKAYTGSIATGLKTITATPLALFAGNSEMSNRKRMIVRNESTDLRMRYGTGQSNLQENGYPIDPGEEKEFIFDPDTAQTIYGVSEGGEIPAFIEEK